MAYEENFLSYLINLEKDNKNIKLRKLHYRSVNKEMKKKKNNIEKLRDAFNNLGELFSCKVNNKQYNKRFLYFYRNLTKRDFSWY